MNIRSGDRRRVELPLEGVTSPTWSPDGRRIVVSGNRGGITDLFIVDVEMPGMNGYEMAAQLRVQPEFEGIMLIALTGYGQEEDRLRAQDAGFDHYLIKPIDPEDLQALLDSYHPDRNTNE